MFVLNEETLNTWPVPVEATTESIAINSLWLVNSNYVVHSISDNVDTELNDFNIPQNNWKWFLSYFKRQRQISLKITIIWSNENDFITLFDNLRKECYKEESTLYWKKWDWERRQIKVNCTSFPRNFEHFNINFLECEIWFTALEPFWYESSRQSRSLSNKTADFSEEISNQWTDVSEPIVYLLFNTATVTDLSLELWENTIWITESITDWDIIIIDSENKKVWKNTSELDYTWTFPIMWTWSNFFNFDITWTFDTNVLILNKRNYV